MTGDEIVALSKKHTIFEWSAQGAVDPIPVARAKGVYFWTPEGKRFIDFNSQLMCVNIGHGDPRVVKAIQEQAAVLAYVKPVHGHRAARAAGREARRAHAGRHRRLLLHQRRRRGQRERVQDRARGAPAGRRSWRATARTTAAPRRRSPRPAIRGAGRSRRCRASSTCSTRITASQRGWDTAEQSLRYLEEVIQLEGPQTIAAFILETVTGTNGILVPPDGYLQGVRALCDRHGILMIADEVMAGFGRTGEWFAVDHWNVVPDLITMAKGLTSAYVQLGAVGVRRTIADHFQDKPFPGGLTYNSHPLACAAALATIAVDGRGRLSIERASAVSTLMASCSRTWRRGIRRSAPSARSASSASSSSCATARRASRWRRSTARRRRWRRSASSSGEEGLYTFVRWNYFFTNPPLSITEAELREGFAIIDRGLAITDKAVVS